MPSLPFACLERKQQIAGAPPGEEASGGEHEPEAHVVEQAIVLCVKHGWSPFANLKFKYVLSTDLGWDKCTCYAKVAKAANH